MDDPLHCDLLQISTLFFDNFFLTNEGVRNFLQVYTISSFHTYRIITIRNPIKVTSKYRQEISNLRSHGYHEILRTTKSTLKP